MVAAVLLEYLPRLTAPNPPELSLLKFLPLTYHHSHFLAATLDFTYFFTMAFLGAAGADLGFQKGGGGGC